MKRMEQRPAWLRRSWAHWLINALKASGKTDRLVSAETGVDPGYISKMRRGLVPLRDICVALAEPLNVPQEQVLAAAGYVPSEKVYRVLLRTCTDVHVPPEVEE